MNDQFLQNKLQQRIAENASRSLRLVKDKVDFCSNDYLGIATNRLTPLPDTYKHGSGGSRLLAGNYNLIEETEKFIAEFHDAEAGLIFNSGYDANIALLGCVPQRSDIILYDKLSHASIRDGIRLSFAQSFSFIHNDLTDLAKKLSSFRKVRKANLFVVTESVFSMDGDTAPLEQISELCEKYHAFLIVDEAHATGVVGKKGEGLVQDLQLQKKCFARVHTFGKGCGVHGAIILGSKNLTDYLLNFAHSFIYTTALPEVSIAALRASYYLFPLMHKERQHLKNIIYQFQATKSGFTILKSNTPIQVVILPGNEIVKQLAANMRQHGLDVRAILYPTVPKGTERLRVVLHSFNTFDEVNRLIELL